MKDRLNKLMLSEKLVPAKFAEIIGVQRSSVSHILSGRNNPSFDVIHSILTKFPNINPDWLLTGTGDMYRKPIQTSIFDQIPTTQQKKIPELHFVSSEKDGKEKPLISNDKIKAHENSINGKEIERVVVFFKDKTFREYLPE